MEKYIPLTEEQKKDLQSQTGCPFNGFIAFFLNGSELGRTDLIEMSMSEQRLRSAEMIGIKEFDDYHLIKSDGETRAKASDMSGLSITDADADADYGHAEGLKYQIFLRRHNGYAPPSPGNEIPKK